MENSKYLAFFVAMKDRDLFIKEFKNHCTSSRYTLGFETSKHTHKHTEGKHIHVYAEITPQQYKAFIYRLKYLKIPLYGRVTDGIPRSYGVVKHVRDPLKMLAYTIKGGDFLSTETSEVIKEAQAISYEKEEPLLTLRNSIIEYLDANIRPSFRTFPSNDTDGIEEGWCYIPDTRHTLVANLKLAVIQFFRKDPTLKMPAKTKVLYFIQYYLMYHVFIPDTQVLHLFY